MAKTIVACVVGAAICNGAALAGPITPPPGPVVSTHKTLTEVEPRVAINSTNTPGDADTTPSFYKITQSGSYYLTGNVPLVNGKSGIEVTASGVTIDLNGFQISGFGGQVGINVTSTSAGRLTVRNGSIVNFLTGGISANVPDVMIEGVRVESCGEVGIRTGPRAHITDCSVNDCHTNAVGIFAGRESIISRCSASGNSASGIFADQGTIVTSCTAAENGSNGIVTSFSEQYVGALIENCTARGNGTNGISANNSVVRGCTVVENASAGIAAISRCRIIDNYCFGNAIDRTNTGNIRVQDSHNFIEGNMCISGGIGIYGTDTGRSNFYARNVCSDNDINWEIWAGSECLVILGTNSGAISGDSGGVSPGSTNPNANYTY